MNIEWAAILSWNHVDGIIRIKNKRDSPAVNFLHWNMSDEVAVYYCSLTYYLAFITLRLRLWSSRVIDTLGHT